VSLVPPHKLQKKFGISYETSMAHKILEFDVKTAQSLIRAEMDINHSRAHHHSPLTLTTAGIMGTKPKETVSLFLSLWRQSAHESLATRDTPVH
jgi:hypothetical protein